MGGNKINISEWHTAKIDELINFIIVYCEINLPFLKLINSWYSKAGSWAVIFDYKDLRIFFDGARGYFNLYIGKIDMQNQELFQTQNIIDDLSGVLLEGHELDKELIDWYYKEWIELNSDALYNYFQNDIAEYKKIHSNYCPMTTTEIWHL